MKCTGYTAFIANKEVVTSKDFLKLCLRNFGVLLDLRDEPLSPDIPTKLKPENFAKERLENEEKALAEYKKRTDAEWLSEIDESLKNARKQKSIKDLKGAEEKTVLEKMISEISEWNCSDAYKNVKDFALEQLRMSKPDTSSYWEKQIALFEKYTVQKYKHDLIDSIEKDIERYKRKVAEEEKRNKERQDFLDGFLEEIEMLGD